jgi:hypothetical protein
MAPQPGMAPQPQIPSSPFAQGPMVATTPSRVRQAEIDAAETMLTSEQQALNDFASSRPEMLDYVYRLGRDTAGVAGNDFNVGRNESWINEEEDPGWVNLGDWSSPSSRKNTRDLQRFANNQILGKAKQLTGPISEKELGFLKSTLPTMQDSEGAWAEYFIRAELTFDALEQIVEEKRLWVEQGRDLTQYPERQRMGELRQRIDEGIPDILKKSQAVDTTRDSLEIDFDRVLWGDE